VAYKNLVVVPVSLSSGVHFYFDTWGHKMACMHVCVYVCVCVCVISGSKRKPFGSDGLDFQYLVDAKAKVSNH